MNFFKRHHLDRNFHLRPHLRRTRLYAARVVQTKNIGINLCLAVLSSSFSPVFGTIAYILIGEPRLGIARAKRTGEMNRFYRNFAATHLADHLSSTLPTKSNHVTTASVKLPKKERGWVQPKATP